MVLLHLPSLTKMPNIARNFLQLSKVGKSAFSQGSQIVERTRALNSLSSETYPGISSQSRSVRCYSSPNWDNPSPQQAPGLNTSKILFDGDCRICQIEISALKKLTRNRNNLEYVDISRPDYDSKLWGGVSYEDAMKEMHVIGEDGKVYTQASAIREMYRACGFGWLASLTELPLVKPVCDNLYIRFAEYRLRKALDRCDSNSCDIKLKNLRDKLEKEKGLS